MSLPLRVFWLMNGNIQRIQAERDLRTIENNLAAQGGESFKSRHEELRLEMGNTVVIDAAKRALAEQPDEEGIAYLKSLS